MCDESRKLVAWLDDELPAVEAEAVKLHVQGCAECREAAERFRRLSDGITQEIDAYCNAVMASKRVPSGMSSRAPSGNPAIRLPFGLPPAASVAGLAAVVAIVVALLVPVRHAPRQVRVESPAVSPVVPRPVSTAAEIVHSPVAVSIAPVKAQARAKKIPPPSVTQPKQIQQETSWQPSDPAIRIAIPADELFPPGAVPAGFSFTADISIAPDGSAQQLRLRP